MRDEAAGRSRAGFNAAADHYDDEPLSFHVYFGRRSVELARLLPGDRVLDVACGSGSSLLPAADPVGLQATLMGGGVPDDAIEIVGEPAVHELRDAEEFWTTRELRDPVRLSGSRGSGRGRRR